MSTIRARVEGFAARRFGKPVLWGLLVAGVLAVLELIFQRWFDEEAFPVLMHGLRWTIGQPVGIFGLLFVAVATGLLVLAFVDNSPTVQRLLTQRARRRRLAMDHAEIERMREFWGYEAREAVQHAELGLGLAMRHLSEHGHAIAGLLARPIDDLRVARKDFEAVLDPDGRESFGEGYSRLRRLYSTYASCTVWYNRCRRLDATIVPVGGPDALLSSHRQWAAFHGVFLGELERLFRRSIYRGLDIGVCDSALSRVKGMGEDSLSHAEIALDDWPEGRTLAAPAE